MVNYPNEFKCIKDRNDDDFYDALLEERCYTHECSGRRGEKLWIIISHSDMDGVTSAINCAFQAQLRGDNFVVYLERNPQANVTWDLVSEAYSRYKGGQYPEIEFIICDRMFIPGDDYIINDIKNNFDDRVKFSWYDHHEGNAVSEEGIRKIVGDRLVGYSNKTTDDWCGATLTYYGILDRLNDRLLYEIFRRKMYNMSKAVNLWDTFLWKKRYEQDSYESLLGQKIGTVDKIYENEKLTYFKMWEALDETTKVGNEDYDLLEAMMPTIDECYLQFKELIITEFSKVKDLEVTLYNSRGEAHKVLLAPVPWKYATGVKELYIKHNPDTDVVICYNLYGGTVYTNDNYSVPAYSIANYIGKLFGGNGGGHKLAAGFTFVKSTPTVVGNNNTPREVEIEDSNDVAFISRSRIEFGLQEFYYLLNFIKGEI